MAWRLSHNPMSSIYASLSFTLKPLQRCDQTGKTRCATNRHPFWALKKVIQKNAIVAPSWLESPGRSSPEISPHKVFDPSKGRTTKNVFLFFFFFFPCQWCFLPPKNSTSARDTPRRGFPSSSWWTTHVPSTPRPVTKESIKMVCSQHSLHLFNSSERKNLFGRAFLCPTLPSSLLKTSANLGRPWWQGMFGHFHAGCTPELSTFERSHWRPNSLETWHIKVLCCQH